jgi:hypothetical protein
LDPRACCHRLDQARLALMLNRASNPPRLENHKTEEQPVLPSPEKAEEAV